VAKVTVVVMTINITKILNVKGVENLIAIHLIVATVHATTSDMIHLKANLIILLLLTLRPLNVIPRNHVDHLLNMVIDDLMIRMILVRGTMKGIEVPLKLLVVSSVTATDGPTLLGVLHYILLMFVVLFIEMVWICVRKQIQ
jgi:hypothetical protein